MTSPLQTTSLVAEPVRARRSISGAAQASLCLAGLLLIFFWTPITRGGHYAAVDILQYFPLFRVAPPEYVPKNALLGDTVVVMFPSLLWDRVQVHQGRLPLWNPYNGWGVPHLGNYQSSVFSPYTVPYYLMPYRWALLIAPFLKLFGFGLLTYLFLRRTDVGHAAALVGGVAFAFGGYNVVWLQYPLSSSVLVVPLGMYVAELVLQAPPGRRRHLTLVAFTLVLAAGLFTGHPETFFFGSLLLGAWLLFRVLHLGGGVRMAMRRVAEFTACGIAALALAAVQLLPFVEYLRQSTTMAHRKSGKVFFQLFSHMVPLQFFPHLLGSPATPYTEPPELTHVNFAEANGNYIGLGVLFLAGWVIATWPLHRSRMAAFFAAVAAVWLLYAYNVAGFSRLLSALPLLGITIPHRSHVVWLFSVACLAALAVDHAIRGRPHLSPAGQRRLGLAAAATGAILLGLALYGAYGMRRWVSGIPGTRSHLPAARAVVLWDVAFLSVTTLALIAALAFLVATARQERWARLQAAGGWALAVLVFLQSGFVLRDFNPTIDSEYFYPMTPVLHELIERTGGRQTLFLDEAQFPPNANLWYAVRSVWHYDGMGLHRADKLKHAFIGEGAVKSDRPTLRGLQLLGIQFVATARPGALEQLLARLKPEWSAGQIHLYSVPQALPRYFTVGSALRVGGDDQAIEIMQTRPFDPTRVVLLHDSAVVATTAQPYPEDGRVTVVEEQPTRIRLRVKRSNPGWMVALQTHFPGWTATVNGAPAPLARANVAFTAVPVRAGVSNVELRYAPRTVRFGMAVSLAALLGVGVATAAFARPRREPRA